MSRNKPTHNDLQASLVRHFREPQRASMRAWSEIGLSGSWSSGGRLDVVTVTWLSNHGGVRIHGYEVKATRSDFANDVDRGKYAKYFDAVDYLSFAVPAGLVKADEVPDECGIITFGKNGWRQSRKAPVNDKPIDRLDVVSRLLRRSGPAAGEPRRTRTERLEAYSQMESLSHLVSGRLREEIAVILTHRRNVDLERGDLDARRQKLEELRDSLGLAPDLLKEIQGLLRRAATLFPNDYGRIGGIQPEHLDELRDALTVRDRIG